VAEGIPADVGPELAGGAATLAGVGARRGRRGALGATGAGAFDGCSDLTFPGDGFGAGCDGGVVAVVAVVVEVVGAGVHDSDTLATGSLIGRFKSDSGVPGAASTLNESVAPPTRLTVTTQGSADASGSHARPSRTDIAPQAIATRVRPTTVEAESLRAGVRII
jgi:hypothetical protein